jgi:hypothetical protein
MIRFSTPVSAQRVRCGFRNEMPCPAAGSYNAAMGPHIHTTWNVDKARVLYDAGLTYYAIAQRVCVTYATIKRYAVAHDWPPRPAAPTTKQCSKPVAPARPRRLRQGEPSLPPLASLGNGYEKEPRHAGERTEARGELNRSGSPSSVRRAPN